jgi:hypothetical protein
MEMVGMRLWYILLGVSEEKFEAFLGVGLMFIDCLCIAIRYPIVEYAFLYCNAMTQGEYMSVMANNCPQRSTSSSQL